MDLVVVPAGGGSRRLGHDKLTVDVGGTTVLDRLLDGLAYALPGVPVVAVGPERTTSRTVRWCREEPPGGGPAAALASALATAGTTSGLVVVLAGDLPFGAEALPALADAVAARPDADAWLADDGRGVRQPLLGVYRLDALLAALGGAAAGRSVRSLLDGLLVVPVAVPARSLLDVDTEDDVRAVVTALGEPGP